MSRPWNLLPKRYAVPVDVATVVELSVPYHGTLRALGLKVITPDNVSGTFELFNSEAAARAAATGGLAALVGDPQIPVSCYQIHNGSIASSVYKAALDIPYRNADSSASNTVGRLWLLAHLAGTGTLQLVVHGVIEQPAVI